MSRFAIAAVLVVCLFKIQDNTAACCFISREPCVYQTCGCSETPAGIVACSNCACDTCNYVPSTTACCTCSCCFRDTSCPCSCCPEKPSPVCSCLNSLEESSCQRPCRTRIYFPEVEYPNTIFEMNPFYFSNCWSL